MKKERINACPYLSFYEMWNQRHLKPACPKLEMRCYCMWDNVSYRCICELWCNRKWKVFNKGQQQLIFPSYCRLYATFPIVSWCQTLFIPMVVCPKCCTKARNKALPRKSLNYAYVLKERVKGQWLEQELDHCKLSSLEITDHQEQTNWFLVLQL